MGGDIIDRDAFMRAWELCRAAIKAGDKPTFPVIISTVGFCGPHPVPDFFHPASITILVAVDSFPTTPSLASLAMEYDYPFLPQGGIRGNISSNLLKIHPMQFEDKKMPEYQDDLPVLESKYIPTPVYSSPSNEKREQLRAKRKKKLCKR